MRRVEDLPHLRAVRLKSLTIMRPRDTMNSSQMTFTRRWFDEWKANPAVYGLATERLVHLIKEEPEAAWTHILRLVREAADDAHLSWVGAGPLEDLLSDHGLLFIERIETTAVADERLWKCLGYVRGETRMAASVHGRIRRAARPEADR